MKKLLYIFYIAALTPFLTGCFDDPGTDTLLTDKIEGFVEIEEASGARSTTKNIIVVPDGESVQESISVSYGGQVSSSAVDVSFEVVADQSTAVAGVDYNLITTGSVTIPSGEYTAPIQFEVIDDNLDPDNPLTLTFRLTSSSANILEDYSEVTLTLVGLCPPDLFDYSTLGGEYSTTASGESTDGCPPNNPLSGLTSTETLTADPDNNVELDNGEVLNAYIISDFHAGTYIDWYGDCYGYTFPTPARIFVNTTTGEVTGSVDDAFGSTNEITSGLMDACNGDITYDWINGFGDTGTITWVQN
ncbi:hypothetical protein [Marivirga sp.]|uniref:hypothetical protein n=1 Tax=Marivirga sp. TaxID=2018662 RepID=UPI003DA7209A